eukprot:3400653-Rhodomonas_salina.1
MLAKDMEKDCLKVICRISARSGTASRSGGGREICRQTTLSAQPVQRKFLRGLVVWVAVWVGLQAMPRWLHPKRHNRTIAAQGGQREMEHGITAEMVKRIVQISVDAGGVQCPELTSGMPRMLTGEAAASIPSLNDPACQTTTMLRALRAGTVTTLS